MKAHGPNPRNVVQPVPKSRKAQGNEANYPERVVKLLGNCPRGAFERSPRDARLRRHERLRLVPIVSHYIRAPVKLSVAKRIYEAHRVDHAERLDGLGLDD